MHSKYLVKVSPLFPATPYHYNHQYDQDLRRIVCCDNKKPSSSSTDKHKKFHFKLPGDSTKWKFRDIDTKAVQSTFNLWVSRTQNLFSEVATPLVKNVNDITPNSGDAYDTLDIEDNFMAEQTIDSRTPKGTLSVTAITSIEQFSRMNGSTGKKMQKIFRGLVPESVYNDARNLVEYCCFRFLSRDGSEIHPCLKQTAFQRLIFITMLAWEQPYSGPNDSRAKDSVKESFQRRFIQEEAFVRIAPAISGVADRTTAHNLFKALAVGKEGISYAVWSTYINELLKVHEGRKSFQFEASPCLPGERILTLGSSRKRPVLKWENNMAWPGKLTLTDKALYFEAVGLGRQKGPIRMDLANHKSRVEKARVGPLGSDLFDSAISVTSGSEQKPWALEFVDLGGEMRRDVWHALISEVISLYKFIQEFGPKDGDRSVNDVYGAQKGNSKAATYAYNGIARLQALQFMRKLLDEPAKLVQFTYLQHAPHGDIVYQTLAVNCWGGPLITKYPEVGYQAGQRASLSGEVSESNNHVFDIDGSVYLRKWMRSPSWTSNASVVFWKNSTVKHGVVLSKNLAVADMTLIEKAVKTCREKYRVVEKTQATIDAAMIEGIPSNIDLFKELALPLTVIANNFNKLKRWEEPYLTASFLAITYTLIFRNLLSYIFPTALMILAAGMLLLKGLKEQGRLGRFFGKVTIRDQPPSNTIQKIIALKEAMRDMEKFLQRLNVSLLKLRTIVLAGQPQITTEIALLLLLGSTVLLIVPFKYILSFLIFDLFTRDLEFRREMVLKFTSMVKERWDTVPAAPVIVLPYVEDKTGSAIKEIESTSQSERQTERSQDGSKPR
ncbi:hypothetical protein ACET3Z_015514 [Daucus carota]